MMLLSFLFLSLFQSISSGASLIPIRITEPLFQDEHCVQFACSRLQGIITELSPTYVNLSVTVHSFDSFSYEGESFNLEVSQLQGDYVKVNVFANGPRGAAYGLFHIGHTLQAQQALVDVSKTPDFALRTESEEGQLLDFPDRGYWTTQHPFINTTLIQQECDQLVELAGYLLEDGYNSLTILHHELEAYVTYDNLKLANVTVYGPNDPHRARVAALQSIIAKFVKEVQSKFRFKVYFQPYELSLPPGLNQTTLNITAGSNSLSAIVDARYTEFLATIPADGIIITVSDSWSPRAGNTFIKVWSTMEELALVATTFYTSIVEKNRKDLVVRLWEVSSTDWPVLRDNTPSNMTFSAKQTQGDYILSEPLNDFFSAKTNASQDRKFMVLVDAFREYNGWTSTLCFMQQWEQRIAEIYNAGAVSLNVWGAWSPGCTWPDSGPELLNQSSGFKTWRGRWNDYRIYFPTKSNAGFSMTRANTQYAAQLGWNSSTKATDFSLSFGQRYFGTANAAALAQTLMLSENAWRATQAAGPDGRFDFQWTIVFNPHDQNMKDFFLHTESEVTAIRVNATNLADELETAASKINPSLVPNKSTYTGFSSAVNKSVLYMRTYSWFKETCWRYHFYITKKLNCTGFVNAVSETRKFMDMWSRYPQEATNWQISRPDPILYSRPDFFNSEQLYMEKWVETWESAVPKSC
eukprot:m.84522 g.84522  ORF g.84522 m.84522 type:complete len:694 (+) comp12971_c0_seq2:22-2103(+)